MVKIAGSSSKLTVDSGYIRLFGNQGLGVLMRRIHAAVIRAGNDLELVLERATPSNIKTDLITILSQKNEKSSGRQIVFRAKMPASNGKKGGHADIVVFNHDERQVLVIEVKDGDTFDTKKSSGELKSLETFSDWITTQIEYSPTFFFCSFNVDDKNAIVKGTKGRFAIENVMTGKELCRLLSTDLLQIDYEALKEERRRDQPENLMYFVSELLAIDGVKTEIVNQLRRSEK